MQQEKYSEDKLMVVWIARDGDGRIFMHFSEPFVDDVSCEHWQSFPYTSMIDVCKTPLDEMYKDLKPMDKPIKMKMNGTSPFSRSK